MGRLGTKTASLGREVVTLKDTIWRLTKRVTTLEYFILKQFGSSSNVLDFEEEDLEDIIEFYTTMRGNGNGSNDPSDSEDGDTTYTPYKTPRSKRKSAATRYGRIPKQRSEVVANMEMEGEDNDIDQYDPLAISALNSCEVTMNETVDGENGSSENPKVSKFKIVDNSSIQRFTCPECFAQFNGKAFLQIHLKKAHPNLRVIIQPVKVVNPVVGVPLKKNYSKATSKTKSCQTKDDDKDKILPPEIACRIVKYSVRKGSNAKQLSLNGYAFSHSNTSGDCYYWRCTGLRLELECPASIVENIVDGTFRRGNQGWAADGLTHLCHPPDLKKIEIYLRRAEAIDNGLVWDRKRKIGRAKRDKSQNKEKSWEKRKRLKAEKDARNNTGEPTNSDPVPNPAFSAAPAGSSSSTSTNTVASTPLGNPFEHSSAAHAAPSYNVPYNISGFPLPLPVSHNPANINFVHYSNL